MLEKYLVGTFVGQGLLRLSDVISLRLISIHNPEMAAMIANQILVDKLVTRLCPKGGTFVDVGAHIGSIFTTVHRNNPTATIIAVEADPKKADDLAARFSYCDMRWAAAGEQSGAVELYVNPKATGYNSIVAGASAGAQAVEVPLKRLDDLLEGYTPDVIKMDIEGAELGALRGGAGIIAAHRPTIMFESTGLGVNALGYSPTLIWEWFQDMGFEIFTPDRLGHDAPPFDLSTFLDSHAYPVRTQNYFAVHRDNRHDIRDRARKILNIQVTK